MNFTAFASYPSSRRLGLAALSFLAVLLAGCHEEQHRYDAEPALASAKSTKAPQRIADARVSGITPALMKPPKQPSCEEKASQIEAKPDAVKVASATSEQKTAIQVPTQSDPNKELATRIRIEYDRECYKMAEKRVRTQLERLQAEVRSKTITTAR
ncbi:MAG: hypothetical protein F9K44_10450 [Hyphomicrobiaceae bacterium]|nr:MAG: hypothetical protein F9K44_10450 [Hyphomicrobiaceae bacterium]